MPAASSSHPPAVAPHRAGGLKRPSGRTPCGTPHRSSCRRSCRLFAGSLRAPR